jgi:hypothetical protein
VNLSRARNLTALPATVLMALALGLAANAAGEVTVQVNGVPANLNPAPTERAGRVFVPLRGVFEQLGATVVYANGTINASGRGHTVSLRVGSQQAVVDGQTQTLDVAPFIIGASTYVPLRFVSQALGASVNYDGANNIVAINTTGGAASPENAAPRAENASPVTVGKLLPARDATIRGNRPTIQATFEGGTVDPNTVHIELDGRDVSSQAYISARGVTFTPPSSIPAEHHTVRIMGQDSAGAQFTQSWSFTSGGSSAVSNAITNVTPAPGATVPNSFGVSGRTTPGATVTVQVGLASSDAVNIGQLVGAVFGTGGNNTVQNSVVADQNGRFSTTIQIGAPSGSALAIVITSTDPNYGVAATPVRFNVHVQ